MTPMKIPGLNLFLSLSTSLLLATGLSGCLFDDDTTTPANTLSGTAATGAPIVGGTVDVKCAGGGPLQATTDATGAWSVTFSGQTLPCAVKVSGGNLAGGQAFHSVAFELGVANITPLTDVVVANLAAGDPAAWFNGLNAAAFQGINANAVNAALGNVRNAFNLPALGNLDPLRDRFEPVAGNALDDILEAMAGAGLNHADLLAAAQGEGFANAVQQFAAALATAYANLQNAGGGGGGGGGGDATLTASNTSPDTGNGAVQITSVTVEDAGGNFAGTTNRVVAIGTVNGIFAQVQLYYTIATGNIWNVSYRWGGNVNQPQNMAFKSCDVSCAGASISGNTVTLSNLQLTDGTPTLATLSGTISSASITTGAGGGNGGGAAPANLGSLTASNNGAAQFGASFAPTSLDSVADIGLGWQYKWSVSATHFVQLNGSTVTILNGNPTWQKPLAPTDQLAFDAVNGTLTFTNLTTTTAVGGASGPLVLNGTLNLTPLNSGPITLAGTGVNYTGSGFNSPVATFAATATAEVWTWQDARGTTMKLTHVLTTGNYQLSFTGMGATPYLSAMGSLNALGIVIDAGAKTATFTNTSIANNNTSTSVTVNGALTMP